MSAKNWPMVPLGEVHTRNEQIAAISPKEKYREITVRLWGKGVVLRREVAGAGISGRRFRVSANQFILSRIDARNGAMGIVPAELDGAVVTNDFPTFNANPSRLLPAFLGWLSKTPGFIDACRSASEGTTNRVRLKEDRFLRLTIPLPPLEEQQRIVARIDRLGAMIEEARTLRQRAGIEQHALLARAISSLFESVQGPLHPLGSLLREKSRNGLSTAPSNEPPGYPILRISAGTSRNDGTVDETDFRYVEVNERVIDDYRLKRGDLLACRFNGNLHFVGKFSLFTEETGRRLLHPDKLIRFRVDENRVLPEYVRDVMNSSICRSAIEPFCQTTAGNIGISAKNLNTVSIPIPPLEE